MQFTNQEIKAHDRASSGWNESADFWASLEGFVSRDGYTSKENFDEAMKLFRGLREAGLMQSNGRELAQFEEGSRWVERHG